MIVKVCGLTRPEDARLAAALGADLAGFVFHENSPRNVAADLPAALDLGGTKKVGVFVSQSPDEVKRIMDEARLDLAQLHGGQDRDFCRAVGPERVIRVFWPQRYESAADLAGELERFAECAAYYLLDSGTSGGGHGTRLDTRRLAGLESPLPWLLAGGLDHQTAAPAARGTTAHGVDLNSGLESAPGVKDHARMQAALAALKDL